MEEPLPSGPFIPSLFFKPLFYDLLTLHKSRAGVDQCDKLRTCARMTSESTTEKTKAARDEWGSSRKTCSSDVMALVVFAS